MADKKVYLNNERDPIHGYFVYTDYLDKDKKIKESTGQTNCYSDCKNHKKGLYTFYRIFIPVKRAVVNRAGLEKFVSDVNSSGCFFPAEVIEGEKSKGRPGDKWDCFMVDINAEEFSWKKLLGTFSCFRILWENGNVGDFSRNGFKYFRVDELAPDLEFLDKFCIASWLTERDAGLGQGHVLLSKYSCNYSKDKLLSRIKKKEGHDMTSLYGKSILDYSDDTLRLLKEGGRLTEKLPKLIEFHKKYQEKISG